MKNEMTLKIASFLGFALAVLGILYLYEEHLIFSKNIIATIIQMLSVALMIWARITFGVRSFHATANVTKGKLVTTGPYHFLRHPIYAALIYFFWACLIPFPAMKTIFGVLLITIGLLIRIFLEEKSLIEKYNQQYTDYSKQAKRVIPFIF
ncbi:MAG: isoprenylcysteine carboxylmethyltransferase family protein [Ginsengibacter sp.]